MPVIIMQQHLSCRARLCTRKVMHIWCLTVEHTTQHAKQQHRIARRRSGTRVASACLPPPAPAPTAHAARSARMNTRQARAVHPRSMTINARLSGNPEMSQYPPWQQRRGQNIQRQRTMPPEERMMRDNEAFREISREVLRHTYADFRERALRREQMEIGLGDGRRPSDLNGRADR